MNKAIIVGALALVPILAAVALYGEPVKRATAVKDKVVELAMDELAKKQAERVLEKANA